MNQKKILTIKEFSRLTGIKRENLRFYDRIELLCPEMRGENNYRYYSRRQLNMAYLITTLRGLGVGIEDIKNYSAHQTPENSLALFAQQTTRIQEEIRRLEEAGNIMQIYSAMICQALKHGENDLFLEEKESEPIFLCPPLPNDMNAEEGGLFSYDYAEAKGVNLGFPCGTMILQKKVKSGNTTLPNSYYFKVGKDGNACKPAGLYAVVYDKCDVWDNEEVYKRLLNFIEEQGLRICGDAYEEYPTGDSVDQQVNDSCIRIEIPVCK